MPNDGSPRAKDADGGDGLARAVTVLFTSEELSVLTERAAAHGMVVLEFLRYCVLARITPLEHGPGRRSRGSR